MMATVDWTSPQVVAAGIAGFFALGAAIIAGVFQRQKGKGKADGQSQSAILSKDVQQVQAKGDINIGIPAPRGKPAGKKPKS